jgi:hypothetical protein
MMGENDPNLGDAFFLFLKKLGFDICVDKKIGFLVYKKNTLLTECY